MHNKDLIFITILVYVVMAVYGINRDDIDYVIRDIAGALLPQ